MYRRCRTQIRRKGAATITVVEDPGYPTTATPYDSYHQSWTPSRPPYLSDFRGLPVDETFEIGISASQINGLKWDSTTPHAYKTIDKLQEWTISGANAHPFHNKFWFLQVVTPGGCGMHREGEFYDTIAENDCTVRFTTADIGGRLILHCHVLAHEDNGAMGWIDVVGGPGSTIHEPPIGSTDCAVCAGGGGGGCTVTDCELQGDCGDVGIDNCGDPCTATFTDCPSGDTCIDSTCFACLGRRKRCSTDSECCSGTCDGKKCE